MKNINVISSERKTRLLTLAIMGVVTSLVLGLAITASAATLTRELELGMAGADVTALQVFLAKDPSIYPQGLVTGYFGTLTQMAVSNFQARNGIATVGRVGPITLAAMNLQIDGNSVSPSISSINVTNTNTTATLNWNTNKNTAAVVYYATSPLYMIESSPTTGVTIGGTSLLAHTDLRVTHTSIISDLIQNTTYYYVLYVRDGAGNETISWPSTFHTN